MAERVDSSVYSQTVTVDEVDDRKTDWRGVHTFQGFDKVKVLDLTRIVAGPYCTMILGDLGAKIFKVEDPAGGDECRNWPPHICNDVNDVTAYFASINRNKKSICVNLKSSGGRKVIIDLSKNCDVLVENFIPGKLDSMGLGYTDLSKVSPHLIYCSITGYGSSGPYRTRPGYDVIAASVGGLLNITGPPDSGPCKPGVAVTDVATGLYAHGAILSALLYRSLTGKGQKINCDLLSTQLASLINIGSNYLNNAKEGSRWGSAHESIVPYEAFPTASGYLTVGAGSNSQFHKLCELLNIPEVAEDPKYSTNALRVANRTELIGKLKEIFKTKSNSEWMEVFETAAFPCGPVNRLSEVFNDPHVDSLGMVKELKTFRDNPVKVVGPPVRFSEIKNEVQSSPPALGQHTIEILSNELKYSQLKINELLKNGDVK